MLLSLPRALLLEMCNTNFTTNIRTLQHLHQKYYRKLAMRNTMHSFLAYTCAFVLGESEI